MSYLLSLPALSPSSILFYFLPAVFFLFTSAGVICARLYFVVLTHQHSCADKHKKHHKAKQEEKELLMIEFSRLGFSIATWGLLFILFFFPPTCILIPFPVHQRVRHSFFSCSFMWLFFICLLVTFFFSQKNPFCVQQAAARCVLFSFVRGLVYCKQPPFPPPLFPLVLVF